MLKHQSGDFFFFVDVTDEWCLVDDRGVYYNPRFRGNPVFESIELFKFLKNAQEFFSRITQRKKRATTHHFWNCKKSRSCNQIMIPWIQHSHCMLATTTTKQC